MRGSVALAVSFSVPLFLSGCALNTTAGPGLSGGTQLQGLVHGGSQPVVGAHVHLMAAAATGYGAAATSLLNIGTAGSDTIGGYVLTSSNGSFTITGDYTCVSGTQVYVLATQGNPGLSGSQTNPNLALMSAIGQCPSAGNFAAAVPLIWINEVTTVASVYALSGFMTDLTHVGSSGTPLALQGITNAFATAANLVGVSTGAALAATPAGNGTPPRAELNTIANIVASCVNTVGASSSNCTTLFNNALNGSTHPTDTVTAALNIAHNPAANINNLFGLQGAVGSPYVPDLGSAPSDFTVAISYAGGGINDPFSIAVDGVGNIWTANSGNNSVTQLNGVTGAAISPSTGYTGNGLKGPFSIAIDPSGNAWVANVYTPSPPSTVSVFTASGGVFTGSPFSGGGLSNQNSINALSPRDVAFDASGNVWIGNLAASVTKLNGSTGAAVSGSPFSVSAGVASPSGVAVDSGGHVWVSGFGGNVIYEMAVSNGALLGTSAYQAGGLEQPYSIAIDASDNIWLPNQYDPNTLVGFTVSKFTSVTAGAAFSGGGILGPDGVAIDGAGNVWISNQIQVSPATTAGLTERNNSGVAVSPSTGYISGALASANDVAVDGSGNVWVANAFVPVTFANSNYVVEFVGAAVPVVTPIATAVKNSTIGARP